MLDNVLCGEAATSRVWSDVWESARHETEQWNETESLELVFALSLTRLSTESRIGQAVNCKHYRLLHVADVFLPTARR